VFDYNGSKNITTQLSHFEIVYRQNPFEVLDLAPIPHIDRLSVKADEMIDYFRRAHD
jgi:hypothetical protein